MTPGLTAFATAALKAVMEPRPTVGFLGEMDTTTGTGVTVTRAVPCALGSTTLRATTVYMPATGGAW
jgi:hypothetical protein